MYELDMMSYPEGETLRRDNVHCEHKTRLNFGQQYLQQAISQTFIFSSVQLIAVITLRNRCDREYYTSGF